MNCIYCNALCIKKGFQKNRKQKYHCNSCNKYQQAAYNNKACMPKMNEQIKTLVKEGCGIRSIGRILEISFTTVISRIRLAAKNIKKPVMSTGKTYEVDEIRTFIGKKENKYWVVCALERGTKKIVDFRVGRRTKRTLRFVTDTLQLAAARRIYTDGLELYRFIIPKNIHKRCAFMINHAERMNLTIRTHLKRLNRKTICFTKNIIMLEACLRIYFWG